jgi:hypothetical protein
MDKYSDLINELKGSEKILIHMLKQLKNNKSKNTVKLELDLRKGINEFGKKVDEIYEEYNSTSRIKDTLPEKEYNRRVNEIHTHKMTCGNLNSEYNTLVNSKYEYVDFVII